MPKEQKVACICKCGYRCGGPGRCKLGVFECLSNSDGNHYVKNCDHVWDGEPVGNANMSSSTCSKCGMPAISHDMTHGP